jgi:DNA-binding SARP family transcriptional activator
MTLQISVLGGFGTRFQDRDIRFSNRKTAALLACIALSDGAAIQRERLVGLLWSEADENKARASLRQAVHELKDALVGAGYHGLISDKLELRLGPGTYTVDVIEATEGSVVGNVHPSLVDRQNAVDDMLGQLESVDPAFRAWIMAKRRNIEERLVSRFEACLSNATFTTAAREAVGRALLHIDPTHEIAVRHLMTLRMERGDIAGALGTYKALWDLLDEEYETEPSRQTQELFAAIKMAEDGVIAPSSVHLPERGNIASGNGRVEQGYQRPLVAPGRLVISIASFDAESLGQDRRYLVQGFRSDLMSSLVKFREWLVRDGSRGPLLSQPGLDEYVLEASAFESGTDMRLTLMLRDEQSGIYLWSEKLTVSSGLWLETQQTVVRRLAAVLNVHLSNSRLAALAQPGGENALAFDRWLRAQTDLADFSPDGYDKAEALMRQLTFDLPNFAPAFSTMAQLANGRRFVRFGEPPSPEQCAEAIRFGSEAIRLDPVDSRAHLALGWAYALASRHDRAAVHHDIATDLNDSDPWTLMSAGLGAASRSNHAQARELCDRALQLCVTPHPRDWLYVAQIAFLRGDYETCANVDSLAWSGVPYAAGWRIAALGQLGHHMQARQEYRDYVARMAQTATGPEPADARNVAKWFLRLFPFANAEDWARLKAGFMGAGAPVEDEAFPAMTQ